jgi:hypothetical protein
MTDETAQRCERETAERTVTLESYLADVGRSGLVSWSDDLAAVTGATIHVREVIADHLDPLPLCWVAEGKQRGATVEEWEVSFDHLALPSYHVIDARSFVTCLDCKEWLHA